LKGFLQIIIPVAVIVALIIWRLGIKGEQGAQLKQNAPGKQAQTVVLVTAGPRDIVQSIDSVGSIEAPFNVKLTPNISGEITQLDVREGDHVTAGQTLVRLNASEVEGAVLQQQAAVAEARQRLVQAQLNRNPTVVGIQSAIRQQNAGAESARADFQQIKQNYDAQIAASESAVADAKARLASANSQVSNAKENLASAEATFANAQSKYARYQNLFQQGFVAAQDVDDQRTAKDVTQAAVGVAKGQVDSAQSALASATAQVKTAEKQVSALRLKASSDIAASRARYNQALASVQVANSNTAQEPAYQANLDALQASLNVAIAQRKQAEARRSYTVLKSPIEGTVTARNMDPGSLATPSTPILSIQFLRWVFLTTTIPVEHSSEVHNGMPVHFTVDALPGREFSGTITAINPAADDQSRQFTVKAKIENPDGALRPGMFATVHIETARVSAEVVVPREAVTVQPDGFATVVTVEPADNETFTAHPVPVKVGAQDPNGFEIKEGLDAGTKIVGLTYQPLREGQKVRAGKKGGKGRGSKKSGPIDDAKGSGVKG
jgi:HlyD family secretion protein